MIVGQNNDVLITGGDEYNISSWKYKENQMNWIFTQSLKQNTSKINSLCFNQNDSLLATCSNDFTFCIWQLDQNLKWNLAHIQVQKQRVNTICFMKTSQIGIILSQYKYQCKHLAQVLQRDWISHSII
ncbi:unnamed protein product [Paramecium sonneborni]|uniref:Uncharacterized protein n=1 Tax=Paramecium sonneborni TaxID=65129 RepID=A0A8S1R6Y3_9CILI|nr:unnamed protein product [Paramecium sonneborni]